MNRFSVIGKLYLKALTAISPLKAARKRGLRFQDGELHLYGDVKFGSEPWIITLGKNIVLTDGVKFISHDGGTVLFRKYVPDLEITKPITLGDDVYAGNNVIFMPGVTVGSRVVIGAGAIVTKDIPDNSVAVGVPARVVKTADEYFEKLQKESLHLGELTGMAKDAALKEYYADILNNKKEKNDEK